MGVIVVKTVPGLFCMQPLRSSSLSLPITVLQQDCTTPSVRSAMEIPSRYLLPLDKGFDSENSGVFNLRNAVRTLPTYDNIRVVMTFTVRVVSVTLQMVRISPLSVQGASHQAMRMYIPNPTMYLPLQSKQ